MYEPPVARQVTTPPSAAPPPDLREPAPARPRTRRWLWLVAAIAVTGIVAAGVLWLIASTVPESTYDEATDALATAEADVARREQQIAALEDEVVSLEADHRRLTDDGATLRADNQQLADDAAALRDAVVSARTAAEAQALDLLNANPEFFAGLQAAGTDFTDADWLLAELGHDVTFEEWAQQDETFYAVDRAMEAVADDRVWDAWQRWYQSEVGSPQETAATFEYLWRLDRLVIEALGKAQD